MGWINSWGPALFMGLTWSMNIPHSMQYGSPALAGLWQMLHGVRVLDWLEEAPDIGIQGAHAAPTTPQEMHVSSNASPPDQPETALYAVPAPDWSEWVLNLACRGWLLMGPAEVGRKYDLSKKRHVIFDRLCL